MTLDDARAMVDRARCLRCALPRDAGVHMTREGAWLCNFKLDREALARAIFDAARRVETSGVSA